LCAAAARPMQRTKAWSCRLKSAVRALQGSCFLGELLMKNQVSRATASLRTAKVLAMTAALFQLILLLPKEWIIAYKLFPFVAVCSGLLGVIAFRIAHREVGQTIDAFRGLDSLGASPRNAGRQAELSLSLLIYFGFFVPLFSLLLIAWTFVKAHSGVKHIKAAWMQHQERELRAARMRSG